MKESCAGQDVQRVCMHAMHVAYYSFLPSSCRLQSASRLKQIVLDNDIVLSQKDTHTKKRGVGGGGEGGGAGIAT